MLKVSTDSIVFASGDERTRSLTLTNNNPSNAFIYKVKTNNLNALQASPNCGFIRAKTSLSLLIKTANSEPFEAKLQIAYAEVGEKTNDFGSEWANLKSSDMRKEQVRIVRLATRSNDGGKGEGDMASVEAQMKANELGSISDLQKFDSVNSINSYELQQRLVEQQLANAKMKQQIEITESKLRQINHERLQIKVNKSIGIICEEYHTSFTTLLLFGLAVFVVGYALAKFE